MLEIKNLTYSYTGKVKVLKSLNANFEKGKLYCIEGASGSGKTTLLSLISGLDRISEGDIVIENESLKTIDLDKYRSNKIGVIFQAYNLLMQFTALDNVLLSMYISKVRTPKPEEFALEILDKVGITEDKAKRKVIELSGGEQQRVAIARAISHSPEYIFADEPTGNLDSETERTIMELFEELVSEGRCVIIVTHSNRVVKYADQIYKMKRGILRTEQGK